MNILLGTLACLAIAVSGSPLLAENATTSSINVSTSNVAEDLCCFYHNTYPNNTLAYLVPHKSKGDEYDDFKLITMYAFNGDLYVYFYSSITTAMFTDVSIEYSDSTTMASDKTFIVENWHTNSAAFHCTVHDFNGTNQRFYKAVAKKFFAYKVGDKHRVAVSRVLLSINDQTLPTFSRDGEGAEYSWQDQAAGEEQVYTYYKDNYIVIDGSKGVTQLIPYKYSSVRQTEADDATELQWLFFSYSLSSKGANYDLGKLCAVDLSYEYITFDASYRVDRAYWTFDHYRTIYGGLYNDASVFLKDLGHNAREASFNTVSSVRLSSHVEPNSKKIDATTSQKTWFFFWNETHEIHYSYNTMQSLEDYAVDAVQDADFKAFLNRYRSGFKYAINFKEDTRSVSKREDSFSNFNDWYNNTQKVTTRCHEAHAIQLAKLTFENEDGKAEFNALMNPVDVDEVVTTVPKDYKTVALVNDKPLKWFKGVTIAIAVVATLIVLAYVVIVLIRFNATGRMVFGFGSTNSRSLNVQPSRPERDNSHYSKPYKSHHWRKK